jgi:hypothetical protein
MKAMTEAEWLACAEPRPMLEFLRARASDRKLRLFGVACCHDIWPLFTDDRSRVAVEVAERYADGRATPCEMDAAWKGAGDSRDLAFGTQSTAPRRHQSRLGRTTSWAAYKLVDSPPENCDSLDVIWGNVKEAAEFARDIRGKVRLLKASQADLLRDVFGNPFRPLPGLPTSVIAWNDSTLCRIAEGIYEERAFDRLPILADALLDAGCDNEDLLAHCRSDGPHVCGCWALDLILGKT